MHHQQLTAYYSTYSYYYFVSYSIYISLAYYIIYAAAYNTFWTHLVVLCSLEQEGVTVVLRGQILSSTFVIKVAGSLVVRAMGQ
jgi:hypothetical protein